MPAATSDGAITALLTGEVLPQSARVAERMGPFPGYAPTATPCSMSFACIAIRFAPSSARTFSLAARGRATSWDNALAHGEKFGYKNSQVSVLAPTGTIGFMMDCDTTGIEPDCPGEA